LEPWLQKGVRGAVPGWVEKKNDERRSQTATLPIARLWCTGKIIKRGKGIARRGLDQGEGDREKKGLDTWKEKHVIPFYIALHR